MAAAAKVLDSWAIIAFLEDEPAAQKVEDILVEALRSNVRILVTTVNLGEVWYSIARAHSRQVADQILSRVTSLGLKIVSADWNLTYHAAQFKVKGNIAYADCFAAALAFIEKAELATGDQEFKQLEDKIKIHWLE